MTAPIVARRGLIATYVHRPAHRPRRRAAHRLPVPLRAHTPMRGIDLFQISLVCAAILLAAVALLGLAAQLDAGTAGAMAAAAGTRTGWFRRRPQPEPEPEPVEACGAPGAVEVTREITAVEPSPAPRAVAGGLRRDRPIVSDDPLAAPGVVDEVDAAADDAIAMLRAERDVAQQSAARHRQEADEARRYADQAARAASVAVQRAKAAELDRNEADRAAQDLRRALEEHRPAPDSWQLGQHLKRVYFQPIPPAVSDDARWRNVGEAAIHQVRGPWPIQAWPLTETEQNQPAELRAGGWPYKTSPGGGADAETPHSAAPSPPGDPTETGPLTVAEIARLNTIADQRLDGDPADTAKVGDELGIDWLRAQPPYCRTVRDGRAASWCTRHAGHGGQHIVTNAGRVVAVWHYETSPGGGMVAEAPDAPTAPGAPAPGDPDLEALADRHREHLAQVIARRELEYFRKTWAEFSDQIRDEYRTLADDVILAGWRPPFDPSTSEQLPIVAQLLAAHEQLADGMCRCGWGGWADQNRWPIWHAEHVAQQLLGTGVIA